MQCNFTPEVMLLMLHVLLFLTFSNRMGVEREAPVGERGSYQDGLGAQLIAIELAITYTIYMKFTSSEMTGAAADVCLFCLFTLAQH